MKVNKRNYFIVLILLIVVVQVFAISAVYAYWVETLESGVRITLNRDATLAINNLPVTEEEMNVELQDSTVPASDIPVDDPDFHSDSNPDEHSSSESDSDSSSESDSDSSADSDSGE